VISLRQVLGPQASSPALLFEDALGSVSERENAWALSKKLKRWTTMKVCLFG